MKATKRFECFDWLIREVLPERLDLAIAISSTTRVNVSAIERAAADLRTVPEITNQATLKAVQLVLRRIDLDLDLTLALTRDFALALDLDLTLALARARDRDLDLDLTLALALDLTLAPFEALYRKHVNIAVERGYIDVPKLEQIDAAILLAIESNSNTLDMSTWHKCDTTHCRAGWAIHLSGRAGYALEKRFSSATAGALIYAVSRPDQPIPNFYASTDEAIADIRKCAAEQVKEVEHSKELVW